MKARAPMGRRSSYSFAQRIDCIPMIPAHKSKGLEYNSVVFIEFQDGAH